MKAKIQSTMHKLKSLAIVGVLAAVGAVSAHAASVLVNGDFTANASLFNAQTGFGAIGYINEPNVANSNPSTIPGWDLQYAVQGWYYYGLNGAATGLPENGINSWGPSNPGGRTYMFLYPAAANASQVLSLAPLTEYQLDFDVAQTATSAAFSWGLSIVDGATTYYNGTAVANNLAFDHVTFTFTTTASALSPTITLMNVNSDYQHAIDFANVTLQLAPVPEPTTISLAGLGILLVGVGRWARRRPA